MNNNDLVKSFINYSKKYLMDYFSHYSIHSNLSLLDVYPLKYQTTSSDLDMSIDFNIDALHFLGNYYEQSIPIKLKKDYGRFFTSDEELIKVMIDEVDLLSGKILEPSCGSGNFLVIIINKIIKTLKNDGLDSKEIIEYIINNVNGNDIDEIAIQISELNVLASLMPLIVDATNKDPTYKINKLGLEKYDFIDKDEIRKKYSVIIGNPPFVTMYGKRSRNMTESKRLYFNTFDFVVNKKGNNKFNTSMFFIENGLKSLIEDGRLIYILDIAFFETAYNDIRKHLIQNYKINRIIKGIMSFDDVASGQIILDVSNSKKQNSITQYIDFERKINEKIDQSYWNNEDNEYKILVPLNKYEKSITEKVTKFRKLDYYFPKKGLRTCCALTGRTNDFIVKKDSDTNNEIFPYLEGAKGLDKRFGELTNTKFIKYDYELQLKISNDFKKELQAKGVKNKKRITLGDKEAYLSPKVFIRQSATKIIASYTEDPYAANNSLYILTNKKNTAKDKELLKYTCGILNSDLITFFCLIHKIIRIERGKTPQIKISDLKKICISYNSMYKEDMIYLVDQLLDNPTDTNFNKRLNNLVYQIYNISEIEINYIAQFLKTV